MPRTGVPRLMKCCGYDPSGGPNGGQNVVLLIQAAREENYPALTGGWSGLPDGQLGFPGNPVLDSLLKGRFFATPASVGRIHRPRVRGIHARARVRCINARE
eukprot:2995578-Pyramimonas_sp.AAC.1